MEKEIDKLKEFNEVESVILFGSRLKGEKRSDIDLCIITSKKLSLKQKLRVASSLQDKHDISFFEDLPIHIRKEVLSKGKILFTNDYYHILELMKINDLEYIKYKQFLDDYHKHAMARV